MSKSNEMTRWSLANEEKEYRVVKSSWLLAKIAAYLVSIGQLLCMTFFYRWCFLNKISLNWPLTLTTQPPTLKLSDNPEEYCVDKVNALKHNKKNRRKKNRK